MKQGFMLLELMIATLIAAMVAGILLSVLSQTNRAQLKIDTMIDLSTRGAVAAHQLEKDLLGAFIPVQAQEKKKDKDNKVKTEEQPKKDAKEQKAEQKDNNNKQAKKEPKVIEKIFYSINKGANLDTLTFITNNPLTVFVGKDVGEVKSKVARVQYSLRPEKDIKDSFALFRQESSELDLEQFKTIRENAREYELIGGIKSCTIKFIARIEKKQEQKPAEQGKQQEQQKKEYEYKELHEWVSEQKKSEDGDKHKQEFPRIPYSVEIRFLLWDQQYKKTKEFVVACIILTDFTVTEQVTNEEQQPKKGDGKDDKAAPQGGEDKKNDKSKQQSGQMIVLNVAGDTPKTIAQGPQSLTHMLENITKMFGQR
jgi:type II secretory pathway component PulJ